LTVGVERCRSEERSGKGSGVDRVEVAENLRRRARQFETGEKTWVAGCPKTSQEGCLVFDIEDNLESGYLSYHHRLVEAVGAEPHRALNRYLIYNDPRHISAAKWNDEQTDVADVMALLEKVAAWVEEQVEDV
jgi:hypothetical protein